MFILVNIGCIECGVSSQIVGVFEKEEIANQIMRKIQKKYSWREGGQNAFEIFPMPDVGIVNKEYDLTAA